MTRVVELMKGKYWIALPYLWLKGSARRGVPDARDGLTSMKSTATGVFGTSGAASRPWRWLGL